jgi:hypothetical protein
MIGALTAQETLCFAQHGFSNIYMRPSHAHDAVMLLRVLSESVHLPTPAFHQVCIFSGTLDLFYPDCVEMAKKAQDVRVYAKLYLQRDQPHNNAGMPTPEGRHAREEILRAITSGINDELSQ